MLNVTALVAAVTKLKTVETSVLELIKTIAANQKELAQQLKDAIAANDPVAMAAAQKAIDDSATEIGSEADALTQAVIDNTPVVVQP